VSGAFAIIGFNFSGSASNSGMMFVSTKPSDQRRGKGHSTADIIADLSPKLQMLMLVPDGGLVAMFQPPAVQGVGSYGGFQFMLQDQGGNTLSDLDRVAHQIVGASKARKDLTGLLTTFSANDPQELVTIDREKAKTMNIPLSQITNALSVFMGSQYVNDFDYNNRTYRVYAQADQPFRMTAGDLHSYYVRSDSGQMVPLDNLVTVKESAGPPVITHYNLFRAVEIDGSPAPGYSSGTGGDARSGHKDEDAGNDLPVDWTDAGRDRIQRQGIDHLRVGNFGCLSHAVGAIRELRVALYYSAGGADGDTGSAWPGVHARTGRRCVLPDRPGDADRFVGKELHSDCGVCRAVAA
jgi:HAE1 family hydrophobic/amphiphilic exporter-1